MEVKDIKKAKVSEIIQYGFGAMGVNILAGIFSAYVIFFFTDVASLSASVAGAIYLVANVIYAIIAPLIGMISDNTNTKWGKYRPYILFGSPLVAIIFILLFSVPNISSSAKGVYYTVLLILLCIGHSTLLINYEAITPLISQDTKQRSQVVMARQIIAGCTMPVIMGLTFTLANKVFGGGSAGWQKLAIIYSIPLIISMYLCAIGSKKYDVANLNIQKQDRPSIREQLKVITTNKALLILLIAFAPNVIANSVITTNMMYFNTYIVKVPNLIMIVSIAAMPVTMLFIALTPHLVGKIGKIKLFTIATCATLIQPLAYLIFKPFSYLPVIIVLNIINTTAFTVSIVTIKTMLPDCVEYGEWQTGLKSSGIITSSLTFINKLCSALGGGLVGIIMGAVGYAANQQQPPIVIKTIINIVTFIPILTAVIAIIAVKFYPITTDFYNRILEEIKHKKAPIQNTQNM